MSFFEPERFYPQSIRMLCPSFIKVWSYTNARVAVIAGTWIVGARTSLRLQDSINQHIPKLLTKKQCPSWPQRLDFF